MLCNNRISYSNRIGDIILFILLTYDVDVTDKAGAKRLRKMAKICENYGVRVQNSVFELIIDTTQYTALKCMIVELIDKDKDSVRFYRIGKNYNTKIEVLGKLPKFIQDDTLIF